ncbi:hypothetical protein IIV30_158L [Invertebrate iridescent virus 30]|uniref:Uncharacterized protein n=1 Tax=Invertebrate iridescent virus 30 TaxID=345585 RepID=W8W1U9_9VIRU|nr:hypothetical protein IIV30_158L [Invertebrate iridescent virus 30]CCV02353.1 hypothetical protein IIV30_158L [Invertebrate iridescent virus 30]
MSSGINFKLYDPVAQLVATGGGGGGGLPLTGGTLTGNLTLTAPAKIIQCASPTGPCDLVNKQYLDTLIPSFPLSVSQGGTGATTLTGYLKGNGTSPITSSSSVPTTDLTGQFVGSVNGVAPTPTNGGNVSILLGNVTTGTLAARPVSPGTNGNIYVVSGDPTPSNNGRTYISDGTTWQEVTTNQAATDARYVLKSGDSMMGNLTMPTGTKITLSDLPVLNTDAANKMYVDNNTGMAFGGWKQHNTFAPLFINPNTTVRVLSNGADTIGNQVWPGTDGVTMSISSSTGIVSINNTRSNDIYCICTFYGTGLTNFTNINANAAVYFRFYDETLATNINSQVQVLRSVSNAIIPAIGSQQFNNSAIVTAFIKVPASSIKQISVQVENRSTTDTVVLNSIDDVNQLVIFRQA